MIVLYLLTIIPRITNYNNLKQSFELFQLMWIEKILAPTSTKINWHKLKLSITYNRNAFSKKEKKKKQNKNL